MGNGKLALNKSAQSQSQDLCWGDTSSSLKRPKGREELQEPKNSHNIHWFLLSSPAKRGKFPCPGELPSHMHTARLGATGLYNSTKV